MTKYDKIATPIVDNELSQHIAWGNVQGPVIVLTIEELREVWTMAKAGPDYPGVFELFLKSKGI